MSAPTLKVLLVEDSGEYARIVEGLLDTDRDCRFDVRTATRLVDAMQRVESEAPDVVLLDLNLPDASGVETLERFTETARDVPVVVLADVEDEALAIEAVRIGAQDGLVKGRVENESLPRALRFAVERHRMQTVLRQQAMEDDLTGLWNRRGFLALAAHHLEVARRTAEPVSLFFLDVDHLKEINDAHGHADGDRALRETADILRGTLRSADLVSRFGGDEFCALLANCSPEAAARVVARLRADVEQRASTPGRTYRLALSVGLGHFDPARPETVEALLRRADHNMYRVKRSRVSS